MMWFALAAVVMIAVALLLVLPPLLGTRESAGSQTQANIAVHRQRLKELEDERDSGTLTPEAYEEARLEVERQLLDDLQPEAPSRAAPARVAAIAVAVLVPALALGVYLSLGGYQTWRTQQMTATVPSDPQGQLDFIRNNVEQLRQKVAAQPDDMEGWLMLGRSYLVLERYADAAAVLAQAHARFGDQPALLVERAEAMAQVNGGDLQGEPTALLERALKVSPDFPKALWLRGLAAVQLDRADDAKLYWNRLLAIMPPEDPATARVRALLTQLDAPRQAPPAAGAEAKLAVQVSLSPALAAGLAPETPVFVLARAPEGGPKMPLAAVKLQVKDLPTRVVLDASMAMAPGASLADFPQVTVEARVAKSGDALAKPGDLIGRSGVVAVGGATPVTVMIDQTLR